VLAPYYILLQIVYGPIICILRNTIWGWEADKQDRLHPIDAAARTQWWESLFQNNSECCTFAMDDSVKAGLDHLREQILAFVSEKGRAIASTIEVEVSTGQEHWTKDSHLEGSDVCKRISVAHDCFFVRVFAVESDENTQTEGVVGESIALTITDNP
jgi:hypothetical protein